MNSPRWTNFTKIIVIVALALLAVVLLYTFRTMIAPTIVAFLLTFILSYPIAWVQQRTGWARSAAVLLVYSGVLLLFAILPALIVQRGMGLVESLNQTLVALLDNLRRTSGPFVIGPFTLSLNNLLQETGAIVRGVLGVVANSPGDLVRSITTGVIRIVYTLVLSFWLLKDWNKLQRFVFEQVPTDYQEEARRLSAELGEIWQAFLRGQLTLALVVGIVTWVPLVIVGMPNAGGLALLAALMEFLPSIGPAISGTIGTMSALYVGSNWLPIGHVPFAVLVGIIYGIIGQLEGVYFIPRFVGGRVKLHPAVTFVGIINGALAFGVLGILLAAPTIASARTIFNYLVRKLSDKEPFEPLRSNQSGIRIPGLIAGRKIDAVIFDLEGVLNQLDLRALDWVDSRFQWLNPLLRPQTRRQIARGLLAQFEGAISFLSSQLWRLKFQRDLERLTPTFDLLRGYPTPDQQVLQPGVDEALLKLAGKYKLVLISTRQRREIEPFLDHYQLNDRLFAHIITRSDVRNTMPQSDPFELALNQLGLEPDQVLMVSDTDTNLRAARAMGMATAGVLSGLGQAASLTEADIIVPSTVELLEWL